MEMKAKVATFCFRNYTQNGLNSKLQRLSNNKAPRKTKLIKGWSEQWIKHVNHNQ